MAGDLQLAAEDHATSPDRMLKGIDTLRFITALWVAFSHGARFPVAGLVDPDTTTGKVALLLGNTTFNGTAAVTIFFVISGLCIHRANLGRTRIDYAPFVTRRLVRIGVPLLFVLLLARACGPAYVRALDDVLWSVYCELVYYLLYPLFFPLIRLVGAVRVMLGALTVSFLLLMTSPASIYLWEFGTRLSWLFNAPLWLAGVVLAEKLGAIQQRVERINVWAFRVGALLVCYAATILATHAGRLAIGYTWTMPLFAIFCLFWIAREAQHAAEVGPVPLLERLGVAGYSIYLVHKFPITAFAPFAASVPPLLWWAAQLLAIGLATFLLYRLIEWPAHRVSRVLAGRIASRPGMLPRRTA
ncbi:acyltransferase [Sphingomonas ginkgonis]|uniref:Acyltransferase n=1 Tax=Sphingomonas ginkgonis TaxID=2315330 RepID=A0A429V8K7_9SPHN|nr:acyltransferase [Sphingomonas ginkgonis]RST30313.1 acyltransferase [Sphingomonas ginkgonis]